MLDLSGLSASEQRFMHVRQLEYMEPEHDDNFIGNQDGRGRKEWAHDKAWDDLLCMSGTVAPRHAGTGHCVCSAYDNGINGGKVRAFECVLDGSNKTPCYYVLMPEETFYDDKTHRIELAIRTFLWRLKHPFYRRRHNK